MSPKPAMAVRQKSALNLILAAAAVLVTLIILAPVLFGLTLYRMEVISHLEETPGKPIETGRPTLTLFPGLSIRVHDFGIRNPTGFPSG